MSSTSTPAPAGPASQSSGGRTWMVVVASLLVGLLIGWGSTAGELGFSPSGGSVVQFGNAAPSAPAPPPRPKGPPPKLVADETEFNFGKADRETPGRHDFIIKNRGRGTLELTKGETSCSCTVQEIAKPEVPPGGSTVVTVQWQPRQQGPFRQSAEVLSNDPDQPKIVLTISGDVSSSYHLSPPDLVFTALDPTQPASAKVRIFSYTTSDVTVLHPEFSDHDTGRCFDLAIEPMPAAELKGEEGAKSGCILNVNIKPGLPAGRFEQRIRFSLNLPGKPEVVLPVDGDVTSPIDVAGAAWDSDLSIVMLGTVRSSEGAKAKLYLLIRGDAAKRVNLRIDEIIPDTLKVTIGKMETPSAGVTRVPLVIEVPKGSRSTDHLGKQGASLGRISIDTGLPESKRLRLLVRYAVVED